VSYSILIGNAELESAWPGDDEPEARWVVNAHEEPDALTFPFDGMTGNSNGRHPGYGQWADFCRASGLYALFYGIAEPDGRRHAGGILSRHPGIVPLTPDMFATVRAARERWLARHPNAIPGWDYPEHFPGRDEVDDGVRGRDATLARLLWLEWWMDWALRTCERPAVHNY
jgi:hypothetical protein